MKIVITGGAGMIGSNLAHAMLVRDFEVHILDNFWRGTRDNLKQVCGPLYSKLKIHEVDLSLGLEWSYLLENADCVFHLADIVAGISYVFNNESYIFRQNLLINANVASACESMKVKRYVYVGTACSFPLELQTGVDAKPMEEEQQFPANPESAYGWSKLMGELDARYLTENSGIPSVVLVFHNVYGFPTEYKSNRAQAIPAMCFRALNATSSKELIVWGDGSQGRAFVHVTDVVCALESALIRGENQGAIQIGPDICTTIRETAETIVEIVDPKINIVYDRNKPVGDKGRCANYSKASALLGWQPSVDLRDGLESLISWIKSNEKQES